MSDVYRVWDQQRSVWLAMKVLHDDLAGDMVFLRRFKREAETLEKLQHPHIVRFYGTAEAEELVFMLMEYVEGSTLRAEIARQRCPLPLERVLEIMRPVCAALHYAHQLGIAHCDVKPANIMIHKNGNVLVADFGIARLTEAVTTVTMVGAGTPAYMAPEQVRGENPTPQTDIYALGVVLFEMLTGGERPFTGEMATITGTTGEKVRWEHVNAYPLPPRQVNPAISVGLETVILKCLEKDPARRYANVLLLLEDLERNSRETFRIDQAPTMVEPGRKEHPGAARDQDLVGTQYAGPGLGAAPQTAPYQAPPYQAPPYQAPPYPTTPAQEPPYQAPVKAKKGAKKAASRPSQPARRRSSRGILLVLVLTILLAGAGWLVLQGGLLSPSAPPAVLATNPFSLQVSNGGSVREVQRITQDETYRLAWSPVGLLAINSSTGIHVYDSQTSQEVLTIQQEQVSSLAFSPAGTPLAAGGMDGSVRLYRVADGSLVRTLSGHSGFVSSLAFSPDGSLLASASSDDTIRIWQVSEGVLLRTLEGHTDNVTSLAFSPNGALLASGSNDLSVRLWQSSDWSLLRTLSGHTSWVNSLAFSPDGASLASGSADETVRVWQVSNGRQLRLMTVPGYDVECVAFSPDGALLAAGSDDGLVRLWNPSNGELLRTLEGHTNIVMSAAFAPDGSRLATGAYDETVRLWGISP